MDVEITEKPLSLTRVMQTVAAESMGAVVTFSGRVRPLEGKKSITAIHYEAYRSMALKEMDKIARSAGKLWGARVAIGHRLGPVAAGQTSVVIAAAAPHRREAFAACRYAIEQIKKHVPIWKTKFKEAVCG